MSMLRDAGTLKVRWLGRDYNRNDVAQRDRLLGSDFPRDYVAFEELIATNMADIVKIGQPTEFCRNF